MVIEGIQMTTAVDKARKLMTERGYDGLLISSPENVAYIGGVSPPSQRVVRSRHAFVFVPAEGDTHYISIKLEAGLVRSRARTDRLHIYEEFIQHPIDVASGLIRSSVSAGGHIGIETSHLSADDVDLLRIRLADANFVSVDRDLEQLRLFKTPEEIDVIRHIGRVAEEAAVTAVVESGVGDTEQALGNRVTELYSAGGGDKLTMLVVGSGERSAEPNAPPTSRRIQTGDMIRLDVIGTMKDYYSDVARTAIAGPPTQEQSRIWKLLRSIRDRTIEAMKPGVLTSDLYRLYAEAMEEARLPKYHFLGHGLGVTLHEEPFISAIHSVRLEPNMVLCVEPLCLLEGRFGMQLEDEVLVTSDGCEALTAGGPLLSVEG